MKGLHFEIVVLLRDWRRRILGGTPSKYTGIGDFIRWQWKIAAFRRETDRMILKARLHRLEI